MRSFIVEKSFTDLLKEVNGSDFIYVELSPEDIPSWDVESFFEKQRAALSGSYPTLNNFSLERFGFDNAVGKLGESAACLLVKNSRDEVLEFYEAQSSLSREEATARLFNTAFQILINTEIAVKSMFFAIKDATRRSRSDLVMKYTDIMTHLLTLNCYEKFVSSLK
jgi:hypothetical protein